MHDLDAQHLEDLREQCRRLFWLRRSQGLKVMDMQEGNGNGHGYIARMIGKTAKDWRWSTLHNFSVMFDARIEVVNRGFDLPQTAMFMVGHANHAFLGVGIIDAQREYRKLKGVKNSDFANMLELNDSAVWRIETSDNPKLSTLMAVSRVLGAELRFNLREN